MRIGFITDHHFSEEGGKFYSGGSLPAYMLMRYVREGSELVVVGRKTNDKNKTLASIPNSTFHLLSSYRAPQDIILRRCSVIKELESVILKCDGVIIRFPSILGVEAHKIALKHGIPVSVDVCGSAYESYRYYGNIIGRIAAPFSEIMHKKAVRRSKYVLYVTQNYLQSNYPSAKDAITVGCSDAVLELAGPDVISRRLDKIEAMPENELVIGHIGNAEVPYKGYSVALKAIALLKGQGIRIKYNIVGGGNPDCILRQAEDLGVADSVVIRGRISHEDIPGFMESIDVYVHPSYLEGLSRSILEAISNAVPVLSSNVGGAPELVDSALLHNAGDYKTLAGQLKMMAQNRQCLMDAAKTNYLHSMEYAPSVLNGRRDAFYDSFFESLKG